MVKKAISGPNSVEKHHEKKYARRELKKKKEKKVGHRLAVSLS